MWYYNSMSDSITINDEVNMITTKQQLNAQAWMIYQTYQAVIAGQSMETIEELENQFDAVAEKLGVPMEDLWLKLEQEHEGSFNE